MKQSGIYEYQEHTEQLLKLSHNLHHEQFWSEDQQQDRHLERENVVSEK
jgi:hypothetical protein